MFKMSRDKRIVEILYYMCARSVSPGCEMKESKNERIVEKRVIPCALLKIGEMGQRGLRQRKQ
jgi:hypothetical protein